MARILVSYFRSDEMSANATLCFWESFAKELVNCGNDVLLINNAYYGIFSPNTTSNTSIANYIMEKTREFDPELIITFNHRIFQGILDEYENIPIVIYDGDELRFFSDLDVIKKNIDRYLVFSIVKEWRKDYLDFGFKENQIYYMPPGTAIRKNESIETNMNISFLGQRRFFLSTKLDDCIKEGKNLDKFYELYLEFLKTHNYNYEEMFQNKVARFTDSNYNDADLWPLFDQSYLIFANLLDLGLHLGGHEGGWRDIQKFIPQIALTHSKSRVFTLKENENFYNGSKISLCPMHPQAKGKGFSWRCFDIMASNACLVSSYSSELLNMTKDYVEIPMFHSPYEAREICEDLLQNDFKRKEIIKCSQEYVEKKCRWKSRFIEMQDILHMKLVNEKKIGSLDKLTYVPNEGANGNVSTNDVIPVQSDIPKRSIKSIFDKCYVVFYKTEMMIYLLCASIANGMAYLLLNLGFIEFGNPIETILKIVFLVLLSISFVFLELSFFFRFGYRALNVLYNRFSSRIPSKEERICIREKRKLQRRLQKYGPEYQFVFLPQGLGDILFFCLHIDEYKKQNNVSKIAFIVTKSYFKELVNIFADLIDDVFYLDTKYFDVNDTNKFTYFYPKIYDEKKPQKHIYEAVKKAMNVSMTSEPVIPYSILEREIDKHLPKLQLKKNKTALLSPDATSCKQCIEDNEWIELADKLTEKGYIVYFNSRRTISAKYQSVLLPLLDTIALVEYGGLFIGYRSGLCDVIGTFSNAKQIIIYPDNKEKNECVFIEDYNKDTNQKYMEYCSIKHIYPSKDIVEFIHKKDKLLSLIDETVQ